MIKSQYQFGFKMWNIDVPKPDACHPFISIIPINSTFTTNQQINNINNNNDINSMLPLCYVDIYI